MDIKQLEDFVREEAISFLREQKSRVWVDPYERGGVSVPGYWRDVVPGFGDSRDMTRQDIFLTNAGTPIRTAGQAAWKLSELAQDIDREVAISLRDGDIRRVELLRIRAEALRDAANIVGQVLRHADS